jgi:hypothetical protein
MTEGRIIAVSDIHGCSTALATLIEAVNPSPLGALSSWATTSTGGQGGQEWAVPAAAARG